MFLSQSSETTTKQSKTSKLLKSYSQYQGDNTRKCIINTVGVALLLKKYEFKLYCAIHIFRKQNYYQKKTKKWLPKIMCIAITVECVLRGK